MLGLGCADARLTHAGTTEDADRQARRQVRVTKEHKEEVQKLLKLMGIPYHDVGPSLESAVSRFAHDACDVGPI